MQWIGNHITLLLLYSVLAFSWLAAVLVLVSVESKRRVLAFAEMGQSIRWGVSGSIRFGQNFYASDTTDELLESMGWRKYISGPTLKMLRDGITLVLLILVLHNYHGLELIRPLVGLLFVYLTLTPGPGPFYLFIRPLFQRIRKHKVNQETALIIQLLRNETKSEAQQMAIALMKQFRAYVNVLKDDLFWLEHEWRDGKDAAINRWQNRHPGNEDIQLICSLLRKIDEIGYAACADMLENNETTIQERQVSNYTSRMQDLNRFLFYVNVTGVILACLWFVMALFSWSSEMDMGM